MKTLSLFTLVTLIALLHSACTGDGLTEARGHEASEVGAYAPPSMPSSDRTFEEAGMKRF